MSFDASAQVRARVDEVYRTESRRVLATLGAGLSLSYPRWLN